MVQHANLITARLVDTLYVEAMVLADEARSYFDGDGRLERVQLDPVARVSFSCESLKVTTRLMHSVAWLLSHRAIMAGDMNPAAPSARLGAAQATESASLQRLPDEAKLLIVASEDLYNRIARIDASLRRPPISPVHDIQDNLARAF